MKRLAILALLLATTAAGAYVRTRSSKGEGIPAAWPGSCVFMVVDKRGSKDLPLDKVDSIVQKSVANWTSRAACSYLTFTFDAPAEQEAKYDGINTVRFRRDVWAAGGDAGKTAYSPQAAAITSVFMVNDGGDRDGLILDADIELNEINFTFAEVLDAANPPAPRQDTVIADLENTMTHELGHLMGLSHTCRDQASFANDLDENGKQPPACGSLMDLPPAERTKIFLATMFNTATPGEISKRTPTADDLAGICAAYPVASAAGKTCERTDLNKLTNRGGCDLSPGSPRLPWALLGIGVALVIGLRSRRSGAASRRLDR